MPRRRSVVLVCAVAGVLSSAGCGWPFVLEDEGPAAATTTTSASAAPTVPAAPAPAEVARATLADREDGTDYAGTLQVTRVGPEPGTPPMRGWFPQDCDLPPDGPATTTTVGITFEDTTRQAMATAAVDVELLGPDGGAPPAGVAVFAGSSAPDARWCQEGTTTPTGDRLVAGVMGGGATVPVYVVSRDGAPLTGAVLRLSGFENGPNATGPWTEVTVASGGCPGDAAALCVPLT